MSQQNSTGMGVDFEHPPIVKTPPQHGPRPLLDSPVARHIFETRFARLLVDAWPDRYEEACEHFGIKPLPVSER